MALTPFPLSRVNEARGIFITSTSRGALPVSSLTLPGGSTMVVDVEATQKMRQWVAVEMEKEAWSDQP